MILLTVPHSGEIIPAQAHWLKHQPPQVLLTDVDRFVDELYSDAANKLCLPLVKAEFHRYAVDLNRVPQDIDNSIVLGAKAPEVPPRFVSGFHWRVTTRGDVLMSKPITPEVHEELVASCYKPFHRRARLAEEALIVDRGLPRYHLDLHSMPSKATAAHKDHQSAGQVDGPTTERPDVVVSDCEGRSSDAFFKDVVIEAFKKQGLEVSYNWPYKGGRMTECYGDPARGKHSLQIELNRKLYMDEQNFDKRVPDFERLKEKLFKAMTAITTDLTNSF